MIIWRKKHMELTKETCRQTAEELLHFLEKSPSSFHAIANITNMLEAAGFEEWTTSINSVNIIFF